MIGEFRLRVASIIFLMIGQLTLAHAANALVPKQNENSLESLAFVSEILEASPHSLAFNDVRGTDTAVITNAWDGFRKRHGDWNAIVDKRTGKIDVAEGNGIPFVPGHGNQLQMSDIYSGSAESQEPSLTDLEAITRAFLPDVADMLGVDPATLVLNRGRSGHPADYLWYVDFDVTFDGIPVEGTRVVFRVNNGNLVQFGSENLPAEGTHTPKGRTTRNQALSALASYIGGFSAADSFIDGGSQLIIPVALPNNQFPDGFEQGKGRGLARVWQFIFRRDGDYGTWRVRVDATTGKMLEFRDINDYVSAQVAGGVKSLTGTETRPMPFVDVSSGGYTNSAGVYDYTSGTVNSALNGQYVKINDSCGPISMTSDIFGNLGFGTSAGTADCDTPGFGGAGNTRSSRAQFYYLNRAKEGARGWLPNLPWLAAQLTANVNLTDYNGDGICNAFWNGTTLNLYKKSTGCSNSGEIQGVGLHEFGHGLDANDGTPPSDKGTGETYGDWTAALFSHNSCIGAGLLTSNCDGYGDPCTSCTGVRDIDYAKHSSNTRHTVSNFTQIRCPAGNGYNGPCGRVGHCESYVSSEALWDLATRNLPNPGTASAWMIMDRLWYLTRPTASAAFTCYKDTSPWRSDGCGIGSLQTTMRAADDDDGNLNGTPHTTNIHSAFESHGIACGGLLANLRGCTQPAVPTLSLAAVNNQVTLSWSGSTGVYDVYRNEQGCDASFIKVANDLTNPMFVDASVASDFSYYYMVIAQPSGNEGCASAPSSCLEAMPCQPPAAPTSLAATTVNYSRIDLSWPHSSGASRYYIYRASTPDGPYTRVGSRSTNSFADVSGLSPCTTYYYFVRAAGNETCESGNSIQVAGATAGDTGSSCLLTASTNGTGVGGVNSSPSGISCSKNSSPAECSEAYPYNTLVTLSASTDTETEFIGWSGACTGTGTCTATMAQPRSVMATFAATYALTVGLAGLGNGIVTSTPAGINCGLDCSEVYNDTTSVTLTATPAAGSVFSGWSGGACAGTGTCSVTMTQARSVTAAFSVATYTLAVNLAGTGSGTMTSTPEGINCGADCNETFNYNTSATLTATPALGSVFIGWSGDCTGTGTCTVLMTQTHSVTATFSVATYTLATGLAGTGSGTLTSTPEGINCGADCNETYNHNTSVTLTAAPALGSVFIGWSGDCTGTGTCTVLMTQTHSVTATFSVGTYTLTTDLTGTGSGTLTSTPAGINCGEDCSETYNYNTSVTLTATPAVGSVFSGWSGDCTGIGTCMVTMSQARSVTATFSVATYTLTVSLAGAGNGTVTSAPAGINCGSDCSESYSYNTPVTLTATPASAFSAFTGWGGACTGTGSCNVTMDQAKSVTASFADKGQDFYTVAPCRVLDTRITHTPLTSGVPLIINVAGTCGVPATAKAVSLNLTALMAPSQGFITLYPSDITSPGTWTIGFPSLLNQANNAVMPLAWNGNGTLAALAVLSGGGSMDMALDVNGYFE